MKNTGDNTELRTRSGGATTVDEHIPSTGAMRLRTTVRISARFIGGIGSALILQAIAAALVFAAAITAWADSYRDPAEQTGVSGYLIGAVAAWLASGAAAWVFIRHWAAWFVLLLPLAVATTCGG